MDKKQKFCKDCKHYEYWHTMFEAIHYCNHPKLIDVNLITGRIRSASADIERNVGNVCGHEGKLWEAAK